VESGQPRHNSSSNGVERLRVATTCGSPLIVLISGRLPARLVGRGISVAGAFRRPVHVVAAVNSHLLAVDAAADHSVTNAVAVLVDDLDDSEPLVADRALAEAGDVGPCPPSGMNGLRIHGRAS
jgi:hypothetical protein